jgi:hypothetical protein
MGTGNKLNSNESIDDSNTNFFIINPYGQAEDYSTPDLQFC